MRSTTCFRRMAMAFLFIVACLAVAQAQNVYNSHDIGKLKVILANTSFDSNKTNWEFMGFASDPANWDENNQAWETAPNLTWTQVGGERRIQKIAWTLKGVGRGTLDLSDCTALETLECKGNVYISALILAGCTALKTLDCSRCNINNSNISTNFTLTGCTALETLDCSGNALNSLPLTDCTALTSLNCSDNNISLSKLPIPGNQPQLTTYTYAPQNISIGTLYQATTLSFPLDADIIGHAGNEDYLVTDGNDNDLSSYVYVTGKTDPVIHFTQSYTGLINVGVINPNWPVAGGGPVYIISYDVDITVPTLTYDAAETAKLKTFLAQPSTVSGMANWEQLADPGDGNPANWATDSAAWKRISGLTWETDNNGENYLKKLNWYGMNVAGDLDLSGFTKLEYVGCGDNYLTGLDVTGSPLINELYCGMNAIPLDKLPPVGSAPDYMYAPQVIMAHAPLQGPVIDLSVIGHAENTAYDVMKNNSLPITGAVIAVSPLTPSVTLPDGYSGDVVIWVHNNDFPDQGSFPALFYSFVALLAPPPTPTPPTSFETISAYVNLELIDPAIREHIGLNPIEGRTELEKGMRFELRVWLNQHTDLSALRVAVNGKEQTPSRTEQQSSPLRSTSWTSQTVYVYSLVATEDLMVEISGIRWNTGSNPTGIAPQPPKGDIRVYSTPGQIIVEGLTDHTRVHIYNISGQLVFSSPQGGGRVEAAVARGVYIVRIGSETFKVSVVR